MDDEAHGSDVTGPKSMTDHDRLVGLRVAALRKARGLSQTELGQGVGVTFQQIQKYEQGRNRISVGRLHEIADLLEVPVQSLIAVASVGEETPEVLALAPLRIPGAIDLLQAYAAIKHIDMRRSLVHLAKTMARTADLADPETGD